MRGFSAESLEKLVVLNSIMPQICRILAKFKSVLFVDTNSGPGVYVHPTLGTHYGSPSVFYNALRFMSSEIKRRLVLIDNDPVVHFDLLKFLDGLPTAQNLMVFPSPMSCHVVLSRIVETLGIGADHVFIFVDPCGCEIPDGLPQLAKQKNVTVLLRYSLTASRRSQSERLLKDLQKFDMPHWTFYPEAEHGQHKYQMLLGTHTPDIAAACIPTMQAISSPKCVIDREAAARTCKVAQPKVVKSKIVKPEQVVQAPRAKMTHSRKRITLSDSHMDAIAVWRNEGIPMVTIAKKLKVSENTVRRRLDEMAKSDKKDKAAGKATRSFVRFVPAMHKQATALRKTGLSFDAIGVKLGVSGESVRRHLQ